MYILYVGTSKVSTGYRYVIIIHATACCGAAEWAVTDCRVQCMASVPKICILLIFMRGLVKLIVTLKS